MSLFFAEWWCSNSVISVQVILLYSAIIVQKNRIYSLSIACSSVCTVQYIWFDWSIQYYTPRVEGGGLGGEYASFGLIFFSSALIPLPQLDYSSSPVCKYWIFTGLGHFPHEICLLMRSYISSTSRKVSQTGDDSIFASGTVLPLSSVTRGSAARWSRNQFTAFQPTFRNQIKNFHQFFLNQWRPRIFVVNRTMTFRHLVFVENNNNMRCYLNPI